MTPKDVATKLNNSKYPLHISKEYRVELKAARLVVLHGASDDLIELAGEVRDELAGGDEDTFIRFSTGTYLKIVYSTEGIWRITVLNTGRGKLRKLHGMPNDEGDVSAQAHGDKDAPVYSDVLIIESEEPIELESHGSKPLKEPPAGLRYAKEIIDALDSRGGFDSWWDGINQDDKNEIEEEIAAIVGGAVTKAMDNWMKS